MYLPDKPITIAIVDDHPVVIEGLQKIFLDGFDVKEILQYNSGEDILSFLHSHNPAIDIVLLDVTLPGKNGIEVCREIKKITPNINVLGFSNHSQRSIVMQMLQNGASVYMLKNTLASELTECIKQVLDGNIAFSKEVAIIMATSPQTGLASMPRLTKREKEILKMIAEGETSADIGSQLFVSPVTVETHRRNLMQKLEVKNVAALIKVAMENGLLS